MKLGFSPFTNRLTPLDEAYRLAVDLNLDFIELAWDVMELDARTQPAREVVSLSRVTGVACTIHLPFVDLNLASLMPGVAENSVTRVQRALDYAAHVDARVGVLHTGFVPARLPILLAAGRERLLESLSRLPSTVPIALENLALGYEDLLRGPEELAGVTTAAGVDFFNTLDFGHAVMEGSVTDALEGRSAGGLSAGHARLKDYVSGLGRIAHLHLHDNDGSADQHLPIGRGSINFLAHAGFLAAFPGTACLEIAGDGNAVRESVTALRALLG